MKIIPECSEMSHCLLAADVYLNLAKVTVSLGHVKLAQAVFSASPEILKFYLMGENPTPLLTHSSVSG